MQNIYLPDNISQFLGNESKEFVLRPNRRLPLSRSIFYVFFGTVWFFISSMIGLIFFGASSGEALKVFQDGFPTFNELFDVFFLLIPSIVVTVFLLVGLAFLFFGIRSIFAKGDYYIGTPSRLVIGTAKSVRSIDWEEISKDIEIKGNMQKGDITLKFGNSFDFSQETSKRRTIQSSIILLNIDNPYHIENIIRARISSAKNS